MLPRTSWKRHFSATRANKNARNEKHRAAIPVKKLGEFEYPPCPSEIRANGCTKATMTAREAKAMLTNASQEHQSLSLATLSTSGSIGHFNGADLSDLS